VERYIDSVVFQQLSMVHSFVTPREHELWFLKVRRSRAALKKLVPCENGNIFSAWCICG